MYMGSREDVDVDFIAAVDAGLATRGAGSETRSYTWPYAGFMTAEEAHAEMVGMSVLISYLAIYIGFVLLITCAAILALQQLTEASDNILRYKLLEKIGAEQHMVNKALFIQIGIYFISPLIVALCHSVVALSVVANIVKAVGRMQIAQPLLITSALLVAIYGGYFLLTYFASRAMIRPRLGKV
jgi:putative ABC transport system permease protein